MQMRFSSLRKKIPAFMIIGLIAVAAGCNKKAETVTPSLPGNEFLTTVQLLLVNTNDPTDVHMGSWSQISPTGKVYQPDSAFFNNAFLNLRANSIYHAQVIILDSTKSPVDSVTPEILERVNYHLFFFQPSPILACNIIISNTSTDIPTNDWLTNVSDTTAGGLSVDEVSIPAGGTGNPLNLTVSRLDMDNNTPPLQVGLQDQFVTGPPSNGTLRVVLRHQPNAKNGTYDPGSTDLDVTYAITIK